VSGDGIVIANAPISYGAFELTVGIDPAVPDAESLLDEVSAAGYAGIDLGPVGYLGDERTLRGRLESRGLGLAGGYIELPYTDSVALANALPDLDRLLDMFDLATGASPPPRPTLADAGSPARRAHPGRAAQDRSFGLDEISWRHFAEGLGRAVDRCRARGYEPTLHCETGTFVEAEWEIDQALERTDIGLCLETGHLFVGGGDALKQIERWGSRINHVHVKDARAEKVRAIVEGGAAADAIWRDRAFCALGHGDLPLRDVIEALQGIGFEGWLVVEQDLMPEATDPPGHVAQEQVGNREYLRGLGL
jgi:inosose dehydratase